MGLKSHIFLGYLKNKDLLIHLNKSESLKTDNIMGQSKLEEIYWKDGQYIGRFLPFFLDCQEIQEKAKEIENLLKFYCPRLSFKGHHLILISQLFNC